MSRIPLPNAASFSTERDLIKVPNKKLIDSRRSSCAETFSASSRSLLQEKDEDEENEHLEDDSIRNEPATPNPGNRNNAAVVGDLGTRAPVILTSKPVFNDLYKKRMESDGESVNVQ